MHVPPPDPQRGEPRRIQRLPNGFVDLTDGVLTVGGGETVTIAARDVRGVIAREGKGSLFSRHPPAVLEIEYASGIGVARTRLLIPVDELPNARALAAQLDPAQGSR